jgi:hypothetical protein
MKILKFKWAKLLLSILIALILIKLTLEFLFLKWYETSIGIGDFRIEMNSFDLKSYGPRFSNVPRNPEWEQLDKFTFFRRSSAYYFLDKRFLRVFYITSANNVPNFEIELILHFKFDKSFKLRLKNADSKKHDQWGKYRSSSLNYDLSFTQSFNTDINQLFLNKHLIGMSMLVRNMDDARWTTLTPIDVKIKFLRSKTSGKVRQGSAICSKCYYYTDKESYKHFEWWFELNKHIGYDKITFCNNSIPDVYEYKVLFKKYENLIYIYQMQHLPNLLDRDELNDTDNEYLSSFFELKSRNKFYKPMTRVFDNIIFNECFLDNVDKYKYEN